MDTTEVDTNQYPLRLDKPIYSLFCFAPFRTTVAPVPLARACCATTPQTPSNRLSNTLAPRAPRASDNTKIDSEDLYSALLLKMPRPLHLKTPNYEYQEPAQNSISTSRCWVGPAINSAPRGSVLLDMKRTPTWRSSDVLACTVFGDFVNNGRYMLCA
jgi:hypothetical protein